MSDLIEKVARALCASSGDDPDMVFTGYVDRAWLDWTPNARAAIAAVLEHYSKPGNIDARTANAWTKTKHNYAITSDQRIIAAAMAAELKRTQK